MDDGNNGKREAERNHFGCVEEIMSIIDKCLICGEKISNHGEFLHGVACLGKLHDLIIDYAKFKKILQDLGTGKYPITEKVTKKEEKK